MSLLGRGRTSTRGPQYLLTPAGTGSGKKRTYVTIRLELRVSVGRPRSDLEVLAVYAHAHCCRHCFNRAAVQSVRSPAFLPVCLPACLLARQTFRQTTSSFIYKSHCRNHSNVYEIPETFAGVCAGGSMYICRLRHTGLASDSA